MSLIIFIDGPPGSGKSSVASALDGALPSARLYLEMDPNHPLHPAKVGDVGADFSNLEFESIELLIESLLQKWETFLNGLGAFQDEIVILESYPFQSHLRVLWQLGATKAELANFQSRLKATFGSVDSLLVFLEFDRYEDVLPGIFSSRGADWVTFIEGFFESAPVGAELKSRGCASASDYLQTYASELKGWYDAWELSKLTLTAWGRPTADQVARIIGEL